MAATISVPQVSSLSAIGSISLPNSVTWLYLRAIQPSSLSVHAATMKMIAATQRMVTLSKPHAPALAYSTRNTITRMIREKVTRFGGAFQPSSNDDLRSSCFSISFTLPRHFYLLIYLRFTRSVPESHRRSGVRCRRDSRTQRRRLALDEGKHLRQVLGLYQHLTGLGPFGRPHDAT